MSFAVVTFRKNDEEDEEGCSSSEIPMIWLCESNSKCWWPAHSKNIGSLIARKVPPNMDKWILEDVKLEMLQVSLEKARKVAANLDYVLSDDALKGRGKRRIIPSAKLVTSDEDLEYLISTKNWRQLTNIALPPQLGSTSAYSCPSQSPVIAQVAVCSSDDIQNMPTVFADVETNLELGGTQLLAEELPEPHDIVREIPAAGVNTNWMESGHNTLNEPNIQMDSISSLIEEHFQKISRMFISINMQLKSIDERIENLENTRQVTTENDEGLQIVKEHFPLTSIEAITNFDSVLNSNKELGIHFRKYIKGIGGNSAKDNLSRILKRMFTNACAEQCSWLGRKNNFAIHELQFILMIKEAICSTFSTIKESDFEKLCAEWFRFAKQRHIREK